MLYYKKYILIRSDVKQFVELPRSENVVILFFSEKKEVRLVCIRDMGKRNVPQGHLLLCRVIAHFHLDFFDLNVFHSVNRMN